MKNEQMHNPEEVFDGTGNGPVRMHLRNRLLDYSRRNRLLYFKPGPRFVSLGPDAEMQQSILEGGEIPLSRFPGAGPEFSAALDRIRLEADRDINEYGFSPLKLAFGFLDWYNLKADPAEKMRSPLLLLPAALSKKKGIRDGYILRVDAEGAEINPVLAGRLKDLYGIRLPETVPSPPAALGELFLFLRERVETPGSGVQLTDAGTSPGGSGATESRWEWDAHTCILGNFRYKKMSLVRDYDSLVRENTPGGVFGGLFSGEPKPESHMQPDNPDRFHVLPSDPTQDRAVAAARSGMSYVIQGPPGTGKSQTIANLVADYVARGKKVLFVCEKRAALDVVYHRLKQRGLHELCALVHDTQNDRKAFILDLRATAASYMQNRLPADETASERGRILSLIERETYPLRLYHAFMKQRLEKAGLQVHELLSIVLATRHCLAGNPPENTDRFPGYGQWIRYGETIRNLSLVTKTYGDTAYFSRHPFRHLKESYYYLYNATATAREELEEAALLADRVAGALSAAEIPPEICGRLPALRAFLAGIVYLLPLKRTGRMDLTDPATERGRRFSEAGSHLESLRGALSAAAAGNTRWTDKLTPSDTENALEAVRRGEKALFPFLDGAYRRAKKAVDERYDFARHAVPPSYGRVLERLRAEHEAAKAYAAALSGCEREFCPDGWQAPEDILNGPEGRVRPEALRFAQNPATDVRTMETLAEVKEWLDTLENRLGNKLTIKENVDWRELGAVIRSVTGALKDLPAFMPYLKELGMAETSLKRLVLDDTFSPEEIEALTAQSSLDRFFHLNREAQKIAGPAIDYHAEKIAKLYDRLYRVNARYVKSRQQAAYLALVRKSELSVAGRGAVEKEEKKTLAEGRKILEHEFSKTMRYKSIRELAAAESGRLIRELKPVWLMSPLSVSDALPLQADYFDVVIVDEASQVRIEEGVPALCRAPQTIVVGDEMQMPPSDFFGSRGADSDEEDPLPDDFLPDAESLLAQAVRRFPSVTLGWHYRSRHESLIAFSNACFYENRLLTVPDTADGQRPLPPVTAGGNRDAAANLDTALRRPLSYHHIPYGIYEDRVNVAEAEYIAELLREFLRRKDRRSIGVVVFSLEQQEAVEAAVSRLGAADPEFGRRVDSERGRTESGQFAGLFIKNLENVQGDERDIIIIGTGYGYDTQRRMRMHFGPLNRPGGEKRLNVAFSRARENLLLVSSFTHEDIRNDHNTGALYLKKYLHYAAAVSTGDMETADAVLPGAVPGPDPATGGTVLRELAAALENEGYTVQMPVGRSLFRCHIGIKKRADDERFAAGILIDDGTHYAGDDAVERYVSGPAWLQAAGWNLIRVFSKDWYTDRETAWRRVRQSIESGGTVTAEPVDIPVPETAEAFTGANPVTRLTDGTGVPKFWEIGREDNRLLIRYGKTGTVGTRMAKQFDGAAAAEREMEKLVRQKLKKGYRK